MNVLLTPIGSAGDNYPFIGLAAELARRGHRATVITNDHFAPVVQGSGLNFHSIGSDDEYRAFLANPDIWHPKRGLQTIMSMVGEGVGRVFDAVQRLTIPNDTIVVAHSLDFASRAIAEKSGLPVVTAHLSPTLVRTNYNTGVFQGTQDLSRLPAWVKRLIWRMVDRFVLDPSVGPIANTLRARVGLPPVKRVFQSVLHSPLLTLGLWPKWFAPPQPDYPPFFKLTGFPLFDAPDAQPVTAEVDAYLRAGEAPIVYTAGSANVHAQPFFAAAAVAAQLLGRRAMLLTRFDDQVPTNLSANVRHFPFAPLSRILTRCAALVHHGGIGTTASALAAGIPQLIMPLSHDQPNNAHWIKTLNAGDRLLPKNFTPSNLAATLTPLLTNPDVKQACTQAAHRCATQNALADSVDLIESVATPAHAQHSVMVG